MDGRGEIAVMSLVLARVVFSLAFHGLFYELAGLVFLSLAALFVESAASHNGIQHFNPRLGTSSGIYMAALLVPVVLVARLIQHVRTSTSVADPTDCTGLRSEFWSAFACSVGLLAFVLQPVVHHKNTKCNTVQKENIKTFNSTTYWVTLAIIIPSLAFLCPIKPASVVFHVIGSTFLLDYQAHAFPGCASLGEALLVANGLSVYVGNAIAYTFAKVGINALYTISCSKDSVSAILQGTLIGLSCVPSLYNGLGKVFSWLLGYFCIKWTRDKATSERFYNAAAFYVAVLLGLAVLTSGWLYFVHGLKSGLVIWVIEFVFQDPQRFSLCGYWVGVLCMSVVPFYMAKSTKIEQIMVRKFFHLMVVIMFIPALLLQQDFLKLAFSVAFAGFLVIEMIRVWQIPPLGEMVYNYMTAFTDSRDSDILIISHFSLLLGCALPLWLTDTQNDRPLAPFAGVLSLGIGDTMASVIGHNYGSWQLRSSSKKTMEGTIAGILSMLLSCIAVQLLFMAGLSVTEWISLTTAVVCTGLMEAYTMQLDNAFLPLIFFALIIA